MMALAMTEVNPIDGEREPLGGLLGNVNGRHIDRCSSFENNIEPGFSPTHQANQLKQFENPPQSNYEADDKKENLNENSSFYNMHAMRDVLRSENMFRSDDFSSTDNEFSYSRGDDGHHEVRRNLLSNQNFPSFEPVNRNDYETANIPNSDLNISRLPRNNPLNRNDYSNHQNYPFKSPRRVLDKQPPYSLQIKGYDSDNDVMHKKHSKKKFSVGSNTPGKKDLMSDRKRDKGHRRVKSGDAALFYSNQNYSDNLQENPQDIFEQRDPRSAILHSQSSGCLDLQRLDAKLPPLIQSISLDAPVHEHLCLQSTSFVRLQTALSNAVRYYEQIEREVEEKKEELNARLNVTKNPTYTECKQLEEEIEHLENSIQGMSNECDKMGIHVLGDPLISANLLPAKSIPNTPLPSTPHPPITTQPPSYRTPTPPHPPFYRTSTPLHPPFNNQIPKYETLLTSKENRFSSLTNETNLGVQDMLPSIPDQLPLITMKPENDHWECKKCTFRNLLVAECEMCSSPRPVTLR